MSSSLPYDYITADTHFNHNNIVDYCFRQGYLERNYSLHNNIMLNALEDIAYKTPSRILHLGDFGFKAKDNSIHLYDDSLKRVISRFTKFDLIIGNHDTNVKWLESLGINIIESFDFKYDDYTFFFDHYPRRYLYGSQLSVHGHLHNNYCNGLTNRHKNVGVDMYSLRPVSLRLLLDAMVFRYSDDGRGLLSTRWR